MRNLTTLPDAKPRSMLADLACVCHLAQIARGPLEYSPLIPPDPIFAAAAPYELAQLRWPEPQGPDRVLSLHLLWWKGHLAGAFRGSRVLLRNTMAGKRWSVDTSKTLWTTEQPPAGHSQKCPSACFYELLKLPVVTGSPAPCGWGSEPSMVSTQHHLYG